MQMLGPFIFFHLSFQHSIPDQIMCLVLLNEMKTPIYSASVPSYIILWQGEKFGYCRFSRNGTQAFLFVTYTKGKCLNDTCTQIEISVLPLFSLGIHEVGILFLRCCIDYL